MDKLEVNLIDELEQYNKKNNTTHSCLNKVVKAKLILDFEYNTQAVDYLIGGNAYIDHYFGDFSRHYITPSLNSLKRTEFINYLILKYAKTDNLILEVWPSDKIRYAYLHTNYYKGAGTLGSSCMRKKEMQKALNFYIQNGVEIVVLHNKQNKIYARALLWHEVNRVDVKKTYSLLDRIYYISSKHVPRYYELAEKNNWLIRDNLLDVQRKIYKTNINVVGITHLPYADTMRKLYFKDGVICHESCHPPNLKHRSGVVFLSTTNNKGYCRNIDPNAVREALTGNWISKKDGVKVKRYNHSFDGYVHNDHIVSINNVYYSSCDSRTITRSEIDGWILRTNMVREVITNTKISKENAINSDKYKGYIHKKNRVIIDEEEYHKQDFKLIKYGKKYYLPHQCFTNYSKDKNGTPIPEGKPIPKTRALIAYNFEKNKLTGEVSLHKHYLSNKSTSYIELWDGTLIVETDANRKLLKKFKNKYYLLSDFTPPDKNQLTFNFKV